MSQSHASSSRDGGPEFEPTFLHAGDSVPPVFKHAPHDEPTPSTSIKSVLPTATFLSHWQAMNESARKAIVNQVKKAETSIQQAEAEEDDYQAEEHAVFGEGANYKSAEAFVESAPADGAVRKKGVLRKRIVGKTISWSDRYITLTAEKMYIRNTDGGNIRDVLDLLTFSHVRQMVQGETCRDLYNNVVTHHVVIGVLHPISCNHSPCLLCSALTQSLFGIL